ncbi:hypothetical protein VTI28DRAFT_9593 [Corynascus sepedonium]
MGGEQVLCPRRWPLHDRLIYLPASQITLVLGNIRCRQDGAALSPAKTAPGQSLSPGADKEITAGLAGSLWGSRLLPGVGCGCFLADASWKSSRNLNFPRTGPAGAWRSFTTVGMSRSLAISRSKNLTMVRVYIYRQHGPNVGSLDGHSHSHRSRSPLQP